MSIEDDSQDELKKYCNKVGVSKNVYEILKLNRICMSSIPYLLDNDYKKMNISDNDINCLRLNLRVLYCYENNPLLFPSYKSILEYILKRLNFSDNSLDFDKPINICKKIVSSGNILSIDVYDKCIKEKLKSVNDINELEEKLKSVDVKYKKLEKEINDLEKEIECMGSNNLCKVYIYINIYIMYTNRCVIKTIKIC